MKKSTKKLLFSLTCIMLMCVMLFMSACKNMPSKHQQPSTETSTSTPSTGDTSKKDVNSDSSNKDKTNKDKTNKDKTNKDETGDVSNNEETGDSDKNDNDENQNPPAPDESKFEGYNLNQSENFIYSLVYSNLQTSYDTFTGYVTIKTDDSDEVNEIFGISYVDYEEAYKDQNDKVYFSAGFISFPQKEINLDVNTGLSGLEITSIEEEYDEMFSYINAYSTEDIHMHCIINNKYVKYDIVNNELKYEEEPFYEEMDIDSSRGNIYNYDTQEYVYIVDEQDYVPITGVSLLGEADYQNILDEVNNILKTQEANLSYSEVESYVVKSQEALYSFLLGLQEESFMGIPVASLIEIVKNLDPMEHLRIVVDENGATSIEIITVTKLASLWEKITTTFVCALGIITGVVYNLAGNIIPGLKFLFGPFGGALIGASMEMFSQVVISNTPISDIQWAQVGVAAAAGAISGIIGLGLGGLKNVALKGVIDTLCDGIIGGTEFFANSLIAGQSFKDACTNFGYGVLTGVVISGGVKVISAGIKKVVKIFKKPYTKVITSIDDVKLSKLSNEATEDGISEVQEKALKKSTKDGTKNALKNDKTGHLIRKIFPEANPSEHMKMFDTYNQFKKYYGKAADYIDEGQWHHIVEQQTVKNGINIGPSVYNSKNTVAISKDLHQKISGYYSQMNLEYGMTNRAFINSLTYEQQYKKGLEILKMFAEQLGEKIIWL